MKRNMRLLPVRLAGAVLLLAWLAPGPALAQKDDHGEVDDPGLPAAGAPDPAPGPAPAPDTRPKETRPPEPAPMTR